MFTDDLQAWSHGPVVPAVYHRYKEFGRASIDLTDDDPFTWEDVNSATSEFLSSVWNTYGGYSAGRLRNLTHEEQPWRVHFRPDLHGKASIPPQFADRDKFLIFRYDGRLPMGGVDHG